MTKIKLIATDMDGTFLNDDQDYDRQKFQQLHQQMTAQKIRFVVASGNQYYQLKSFFAEYPDTLFIAENGALIAEHDRIIWVSGFPQQNITKILNRLAEYSQVKLVVAGEKSAYILESASEEFYNWAALYCYKLAKVRDFAEIDDKILKVSVTCPVPETDQLVKAFNRDFAGIGVATSSGHGDIDIIQPGVNKATGLSHLGELLTISSEEMCAFGDGGNDLEMLQFVGESVAMENASELIKKTSKNGTQTNNQQGVLNYIQNLLSERG